EFYRNTVIALARFAALFADAMDRYFWDVLVRGVGGIAGLFGILTKGFDEHAINAGVDETTVGARGLARLGSNIHSGQVQIYLSAIGVGMVALLLIYAWLG